MPFGTQRPSLEEALEALQRSEQRYRSLVEATALSTWIATPDGALLSDIPSWREITGQSREEVLGEGWLAAIHPDDREEIAAVWAAAVASVSIYSAEYRIRRAAGGWTWLAVRGAPVLERDGRVREYVGLCMDVSGRKELELALEQERFLLQRVIEQAPVGVALLWGEDLVYRLANRRYKEMVPPREFLGLPLLDAFPEVRGAGYERFKQVRETQRPALLEEFAVPIDDEFSFEGRRHYTATLSPVPHQGGPGGLLVIALESTDDVRRRAALSEQLDHQRTTAEALQRALLPETIPALPGIAFAARYVPAGRDVLVGGDWYDVLGLEGTRIGLTVGDVAGKGVTAAAIMGQVRAAVRAHALEPHDGPADVIRRLARFFLVHEPGQMATLSYAEADPSSRVVRFASAGHLPPLLLVPGEPPALVWGGRTVPLGVADSAAEEVVLGPLPAGATLVLYTDGLVETRTESLDDGFARLSAAAADGEATDLETLCDRLLALGGRPTGRRDDIALLAVRFT